ncbi:MAG: GNAT family N-acetyltransferase [Spirochaetae bacterium HGW-Spirochaetae-8]|jgi:GNAT superfamily N-acetyltransferase|nr:MAG: GNAT family N-acetyltransferase [Spirochaetae bacterium HGW-Spirochaetae-8]
MPDMLVNLLDLPELNPVLDILKTHEVVIRRAIAPDKMRIIDWVLQHSSINAASECDVCFGRIPISCFVATRGKTILGYACYNATAPDFFGPTRVLDSEQGKGIGKALLIRSLFALRDEGYIYGIIGGVGPAGFYTKCVGASLIPNSTPGLYKDFLGGK